tara:strand:+ start:637 stop:1023 length:387 start_codon:yes stop_codon:yes gene_type:complete
MILGLAVKYERPVSVGNKVFLGVTATKDTSTVFSVINVTPFMRQIEHVMYISTVTNFRPFNLYVQTDDDFSKFDIVMDNIQASWNGLLQSGAKIVSVQGATNQGTADTDFGLLSNGDEIGKFLIIGSR